MHPKLRRETGSDEGWQPLTYAFLNGPSPIAFAHRGGSSADENGLAAFGRAARMGFRYIETDVRATRDGIPFIFHDKRLGRMTGCNRALHDLKASEVRRLSLPRGEPIPTLRETLEAFPNLRFNLDLKEDAAVEPVAKVLEGIKAQLRVCVTSFSERRVAMVRRRLGPSVCTGLGISGVLRTVVDSMIPWGGTRWSQTAAVIQLPLEWRGVALVTPTSVDKFHEAGLAVHVWTLNDRAAIGKALDAGVDGVMTDRPELLKEVLLTRGLWRQVFDSRD